jgi:hypothetical protein
MNSTTQMPEDRWMRDADRDVESEYQRLRRTRIFNAFLLILMGFAGGMIFMGWLKEYVL